MSVEPFIAQEGEKCAGCHGEIPKGAHAYQDTDSGEAYCSEECVEDYG